MKRLVSIVGSLLGLLVLVVLVVFLSITFSRQQGEPVSLQSTPVAATPTPTLGQFFESPIETPTPSPSPTIPPTLTRPPKPSPSPTPVPTSTSSPTPLPLSPSAFYALWAESFPEGQGSVLWLADPRDIGARKEVLRFELDAIVEIALSPDGQRVALITAYWDTATLWVASADGSELKQFDQGPGIGGPLLWSRDSRLLTCGMSWREEAEVPGYKTGTPVAVPVWRGAIELLDVTIGEKKDLLKIEPETPLGVLGWSDDGRELYYSLAIPQKSGYEYEIWAVDRDGQNTRRMVSLGREPVSPVLSPDGTKFLVSTSESLAWISVDGREGESIGVARSERGYQAIWASEGGEVIISQRDEKQSLVHVTAVDIRTEKSKELGDFLPSPSGYNLRAWGLSPDYQWLAVSESTGLYLAHLPTGQKVSISTGNQQVIFVAWAPSSEKQ